MVEYGLSRFPYMSIFFNLMVFMMVIGIIATVISTAVNAIAEDDCEEE